jgi:hypothetical protein
MNHNQNSYGRKKENTEEDKDYKHGTIIRVYNGLFQKIKKYNLSV